MSGAYTLSDVKQALLQGTQFYGQRRVSTLLHNEANIINLLLAGNQSPAHASGALGESEAGTRLSLILLEAVSQSPSSA